MVSGFRTVRALGIVPSFPLTRSCFLIPLFFFPFKYSCLNKCHLLFNFLPLVCLFLFPLLFFPLLLLIPHRVLLSVSTFPLIYSCFCMSSPFVSMWIWTNERFLIHLFYISFVNDSFVSRFFSLFSDALAFLLFQHWRSSKHLMYINVSICHCLSVSGYDPMFTTITISLSAFVYLFFF